jgi:phospholipid/cholesterol/gamma-HCH transport system substrate-binding protein
MVKDTGKKIRVGATIAIGLLAIFAAFFAVGNQEGMFTSKYDLRAKFINVEGLTVGAPVRLGGVKVGNVKDIDFSEDWDKRIVVILSIRSSNFGKIRKNSVARLGSQGLLGDRTIDISVGEKAAEPLAEYDFITTQESPQLNEIISSGGDVIQDFKITAHNTKEISQKINTGTGSLAQILNDPRLYTNLDSLLNLWSRITLKIESGQGFLSHLVNDSALYVNLSGTLSETKTLLARINAGEGTLGKMAKDKSMYNHIDSVLVSIDSTLALINGGQGTIGRLASDSTFYQKMNTTMESLNNLIMDIKTHPGRYVKVSVF